MGFGFSLFCMLILFPGTCLLLLIWVISRKKVYGKMLAGIWLGVFGLIALSAILHFLTDKKVLKKSDYYGQYIINRQFFPGSQADWQYEHFRFKISDNDSVFFSVTEGEKIVRTYKGKIRTVAPYGSERLVLDMEQPTHHILSGAPTIYRNAWSFYLVFHSRRFHNVYFKKGKWSTLKDE